jgi:hypothetical protein
MTHRKTGEPVSREELEKLVASYTGPITKCPPATTTFEECESDKLDALLKRKWEKPTLVELPPLKFVRRI